MHSFEYQPPKPTALTRALWRAAGADAGILQACPYGEQVKFACLGGIVASTGVLAAFASSYAFYTIFAPAQAHANSIENAGAFAMATFFGVLWGLVIFNLDRYIVASTGKGDGTEAITWQEFKNAVPRMLLGIIIAITISKPLELRIFKPEIDAYLYRVQQQEETKNRHAIEANYEPKFSGVHEKIAPLEAAVTAQQTKADAARAAALAELDGTGGSGRASPGPIFQAKQRVAEQEQQTLEALRARNGDQLAALRAQLATLESDMQQELVRSREAASGLSGFLARMQAAHVLAGSTITLAITLLFVAIELTPIFFKLMLIKGPYDYFEENLKELMLAQQGIERRHEFFGHPASEAGTSGKAAAGKTSTLERTLFHKPTSELTRTKAEIATQHDLASTLLERWKEREAKSIQSNLDSYVVSGGTTDRPRLNGIGSHADDATLPA